MDIQEAVKKAMEEDAVICRKSVTRGPDDNSGYIKPADSYDPCTLLDRCDGKIAVRSRWWNPTADDLMADDWMVTHL